LFIGGLVNDPDMGVIGFSLGSCDGLTGGLINGQPVEDFVGRPPLGGVVARALLEGTLLVGYEWGMMPVFGFVTRAVFGFVARAVLDLPFFAITARASLRVSFGFTARAVFGITARAPSSISLFSRIPKEFLPRYDQTGGI
jgi:hypothetical protein